MDIVVVGAGISGLATAWSLTKRGHQVTLLEQGPIPNPRAASGDHHRIIRRAYPAATGYGRAITEAYDAWDELWADLGASHHDPRGFLCVSRAPGDEAERCREGLEAGGFPFESMSARESVERWPFLKEDTIRYGYFSTEGGALHCRRIAADLVTWLRAQGAGVRDHALVAAVDADLGRVTLSTGEVIAAELVIVTAGAWVLKLFPELAGDLATYRTAVVYLEPPADLAEDWETAPVILDVGGQVDGYIVPPSGGAGLKFGTGLHKAPTSDADLDRVPVPGEGELVRNQFAEPIARIEEYAVNDVVTCAYTFTADERFFAQERARALIVSACSGHGYKFGAAVGRRVADYAETRDERKLKAWLRAELPTAG